MRSDHLLLADILDAIDTAARYLPPDRAKFDADPPLQSHILRQVQIVGEAAWRLSKPLKGQAPQVPWKQIEGMRHIVVHDYFRVDWNIVFAPPKPTFPRFGRRSTPSSAPSRPPPHPD